MELHDAKLSNIQSGSAESYVFKGKDHINSVLDKLVSAATHRNNAELDTHNRVSKSVSEGIEIINQRQKLIKMADSSKFGWLTVDQYCYNPLASDSDDEKRMYNAEMRADKHFKEEKMKKTQASLRAVS